MIKRVIKTLCFYYPFFPLLKESIVPAIDHGSFPNMFVFVEISNQVVENNGVTIYLFMLYELLEICKGHIIDFVLMAVAHIHFVQKEQVILLL